MFLIAGLGGCSNVDRAEWREEVQLATGEIVVIERTSVRNKSGFPASVRGVERERKIIFPGQRIVWTSDGSMLPIAMEIRDRDLFIAINIDSRENCKRFEDPPSSMVYFRWNGSAWIRISKDEYPFGGKANLLMSPWGRDNSEDARGLIRSKEKSLAKPYNNGVNDPLEKVLKSNWIDACSLQKKN